jgi:LytS/YehU family sensor histidine kinase
MIHHGHSIVRIVVFNLIVWCPWAILTLVIFAMVDRFPFTPPRARNILVHTVAAAVFALTHIVFWIQMTVSVRPYGAMTIVRLSEAFPDAYLARLPLEIILYLGVLAVAHAMRFARRATELERSLVGARLHALELQIQPHFLFNTLNSVSALVRARKNAEAVEVIAGLSDVLRYTLDHAGAQRVSLEQETAMLERYLGIQQVRFADRLEVSIDVASDARRAAVPTLILQPLAENAIRHGIAQSAAAGRVEVRAFRRDDVLEIEMFNTGSLGRGGSRGIGLRNTEERLQQLYGAEHRFELRESDGGVLASIAIPWSEVA